MDSFTNFMSDVYLVYIKTYSKNNECFVGEENGKIKSVAMIARPHSPDINLLDYFRSGAFKLLKKISLLPKLLKFLDVLEEGHKPCNGIKEHSWMLEFLAVDKFCKGQQLGTKMLNECVIPYIMNQSCGTKPVTFITFTNTEINSRFYLKNGFTEFDYTTIQRNGKEIGNWSFRMTINPA
ncbi:GNAT family N-acetyltransferase [Caldalkalibacillus mannanilyticus]|uniref:GNAT family N-acetyltransferase n=1 Tax=Caldalkalibacillus mannanilyticus TaxID=1418 RepID=UPI000B321589|nr:GNAT family N-acetyltransferase [Caldalkalibacillus mannanilyticus]